MTCQEYKEWIEEKWEEPIVSRKKGYKDECKKKKCNFLCINKWKCALLTFWYAVVEWVIRIITKWLVYVICRVIAAIITLLDAIWNAVWWLYCMITASDEPKSAEQQEDARDSLGDKPKSPEDIERRTNLTFRSMRTLRIQAIIVDKDAKTLNAMTESGFNGMIAAADRILRERAHIRVMRKGSIKRTVSAALYDIEVGSGIEPFGEWLLNIGRLIGRDSPLHLTVYAVGRIGGHATDGIHHPLYGSVFVTNDSLETTLCHELGHALLNLDNMGHRGDVQNLMYATDNEAAVGWPTNTPTLEFDQWCAMRQSRWLDFEWTCEVCS